jgi:hypothetical protein
MPYHPYRESGIGTKNSHHQPLFNHVYAARINVNLMTLSHAQPKEHKFVLCAATIREKSNQNGENLKRIPIL